MRKEEHKLVTYIRVLYKSSITRVIGSMREIYQYTLPYIRSIDRLLRLPPNRDSVLLVDSRFGRDVLKALFGQPSQLIASNA